MLMLLFDVILVDQQSSDLLLSYASVFCPQVLMSGSVHVSDGFCTLV